MIFMNKIDDINNVEYLNQYLWLFKIKITYFNHRSISKLRNLLLM